ncbi:GGDEF domain-containing protein [Haloimpatiens sp. FM7315]|uniref:GGDEF domain-containing protein n=1 Tax=Haloimpatiens sp. FM7315 TaxID=3298609 RepID=UPI003977DE41
MNCKISHKFSKKFLIIYAVISTLSFILVENSNINKCVMNGFLVFGEAISFMILYCTYSESRERDKKYWLYLFLSIFSYFLGDLLWIIKDIFFDSFTGLIYISQVFFLLQYPFSIIALLYIAWEKKNLYLSIQVFLDMLVIVIAISVVGWRFLVRNDIINSHMPFFEKFFLISNPIGDLAILFSIILILLFSKSFIAFRVVIFNIIALIIEVTADLINLYVKTNTINVNTDFLELMWLTYVLLVSYSALVYKYNGCNFKCIRQSKKNENYTKTIVKIIIPYLSIGVLFTAIFCIIENIDIIMWGFAICVGLVIISQLITLMENKRLMQLLIESNNELEYKTFELETINRQLKKSNLAKESQLNRDFLTGLHNRRYIYKKLDVLFKNKFYNKASVLMIDIDYFKKINDTYGHEAGDKVLKQVSMLMKLYTRTNDSLIRFGGEEFICVLLDTDISIARDIADRIREKVEAYDFKIECIKIKVTVSIGVSEARLVKCKEDIELAIKKADKLLYKAKQLGRNQVCI